MGLTLTVLGCSGSYPGRGAACSGYLVRDGKTTVWLDAGSGTMANLQLHVGLDEVDAVVISHEHPDHWRDLEGYNIALRYGLDRKGVPVYAPASVRQFAYQDTEPYLVWNTVTDGDRVEIGTMVFTFSATDHPPETLACRIDAGGRSLGYSADTGPGWHLRALGPGLDLALCEATMSDDADVHPIHLTARQAGTQAAEAGAGRLVVTHFWPTSDPQVAVERASEAFGRAAEMAVPNREYEI